MFLADFHVHTTFSDGRLSVPEVVDLYGQRGFGAIAITDHLCEDSTFLGKASAYLGCTLTPATFGLYMDILQSEAERAWDTYRMVIIPGFELTKNSLSNHRSAHILGLGVSHFVSANDDVLELAKKIRAQGALAIAAHPVWTKLVEKQTYHLWSRRQELAPYFDAWEVASGRYLFEEVQKSRLPVIATSDLHMAHQIRAWKTVLHCERHPEAILQAIRKQEIDIHFFEEDLKNDLSRHNPVSLGFRPGAHSIGNFLHAQ